MNTDNFDDEYEANDEQVFSVALTGTFLLLAPTVIVWPVASFFF